MPPTRVTPPVRVARVFAALLLAAALIAPATPVLAWANGGGDGYGTHDWVVDQAVRVLDGRVADWFDPATARLASDDPDTVENHNEPLINEHTYREKGRRGGAPARIANEYDMAQAAYQDGMAARGRGDEAAADAAFHEASYHIGLLSHFVADLSQPFHTAYAAINDDRLHHDFEQLVGPYTRHRDDMPAWQSNRRTVNEIDDILKTAVATAAYSRPYYKEVRSILVDSGATMTSRLSDIVANLMKRAANDLADIIWSISRGVGAQPDLGRLEMKIRWTGIRPGDTQALFVRAYDTQGNPIEGLRIDVDWPTADGSRREYLYTDPEGYQQRYLGVGTKPKLVLRPCIATVRIRGVETVQTRYWTLSPRLADGKAGFKTTVSDSTPAAGDTVRVTSTARDAYGNPVPNLLVTWTWDDGTTVVRTRAYTDANGRATSTRAVDTGTPTTSTVVTARTQAGSTNRSSSTSYHREP